mmetsp:Transcript_12687/g.19108  ORF Transcript_12687/g.19108 Transcript_12687/m.19108 type:complete len:223 (+) Transcript_12687:196-864(+)
MLPATLCTPLMIVKAASRTTPSTLLWRTVLQGRSLWKAIPVIAIQMLIDTAALTLILSVLSVVATIVVGVLIIRLAIVVTLVVVHSHIRLGSVARLLHAVAHIRTVSTISSIVGRLCVLAVSHHLRIVLVVLRVVCASVLILVMLVAAIAPIWLCAALVVVVVASWSYTTRHVVCWRCVWIGTVSSITRSAKLISIAIRQSLIIHGRMRMLHVAVRRGLSMG